MHRLHGGMLRIDTLAGRVQRALRLGVEGRISTACGLLMAVAAAGASA